MAGGIALAFDVPARTDAYDVLLTFRAVVTSGTIGL